MYVRLLRLFSSLLSAILLLPAVGAVAFRHSPVTLHDLGPHAGRLTLRFTGATGHVLGDGQTVILLDPVSTRPRIWELGLGPLHTDDALSAEVFPKADFILVNHAHFDHVADTPAIALRTGATIVGSRSVMQLARSRGVPEAQLREVVGGEQLQLGSFVVEVVPARHAPVMGVAEPMHGEIPADAGALWFWEYLEDQTFSFSLYSGDSRVWFHPTSTLSPRELAGRPANTLIMGVSGEPITAAKWSWIAADLPDLELVVPTHHDNFFQPRGLGLALFPGLDVGALRANAVEALPAARTVFLDIDQEIRLP